MTDSSDLRSGPAWLYRLPPVRWLADYHAAWLPGDVVAGVTLAAYAIPVSLAYAGLAGLPPQVGYLRLSAGRARLRPARVVAPTGDRADLRHLADDRRHGRRDGGRGRATLRADRQPHGLHRGGALPDRLGAAAERARQADQRQHPRRLQGRRRVDHRDDPAAEPVWRGRRRAQFLRAGGAAGRAARPDPLSRAGRRRRRDRAARGWASACCRESRSRSASSCCRSSPHPCSAFRRSAWRRPAKSRPACPLWRGRRCGCATSRGSSRWPPDACCSPISKASPPPAPSRLSTAMRWTRGRSCSASARQISRPRSGTAIRWRAACRNRRSTTRRARARPLALVFASLTLALCLLFLTGLLENLPKAVLAAVVLTAIAGLLDFPALYRMWRVSRMDFYAAAIALGRGAAARDTAGHPAAPHWPPS